jgi:uncharacterized Tic20 family protein
MDKTSTAKKIIHYRKLKGITQESLAEISGLNVRTIQRIESGEVDPRLFTLKSIADALEVRMEELLPEPTQHELNQIAILHITPIGFFIIPVIGNVLFPFIFWMLKREEFNNMEKHGKDILNGQITYSIISGLLIGVHTSLAFILMLFPQYSQYLIKYFMNVPRFMLAGVIISIVLFGMVPAINALRVYRGKKPFKYPLKISFFR